MTAPNGGGNTFRVRIVVDNLPGIVARMDAIATQVVASTAQAIASVARAGVPVDTGELQSSIQAHQIGQNHWEVTAGTDHAAHVEYGTARHGGPQPYMVPAAHQQEPTFEAEMRRVVE